jgi:nitric oxide dioxygenase
VFIAGGVGITPLLAMLHQRLATAPEASTTMIQTAVNGDMHAFRDEIQSLKNSHQQLDWHVRYSRPKEQDRQNQNHDSEGLIDKALLDSLDKDADFYLCGPQAMMQQCYSLLTEIGVSAGQIFTEAFGPAQPLHA